MQLQLADVTVQYLRGLVRMEIRRQRRKLDRFAPLPGQDPDEAAGVRKQFEQRLELMLDTYRALGGDPDLIAPRGGRS